MGCRENWLALISYSISLESCHECASYALSSFLSSFFYRQSIRSPDLVMYPNEDVNNNDESDEKD